MKFANIINTIKAYALPEEYSMVNKDHTPKGKIKIVTQNERVKFEADLTRQSDFRRAISLLKEELDIVFDIECESNYKVGKVSLVTPKSRVRFEADLTVEEDFNRAIRLLTDEQHIMFPDE